MADIIDLRIKILNNLEDQVERELSYLKTPPEILQKEHDILNGRERDFGVEAKVSENEHSTFRNLWLNVGFRERELRRAMGMTLLYYHVGPIDPYLRVVISKKESVADYSEQFWISYGDFQIKSCSFLDSVGAFLAFAFFGIFDAPLYFNQVIDCLDLKYTHQLKRIILDGEPFSLQGRRSWDVLKDAKKRYQEVRKWRDEVIHVFSPLMYLRIDDDWMESEMRQILRTPELKAAEAIQECKNSYWLLNLARIAADDLAYDFISSHSYHRDYYY